ncbi:MAG: hypothetical protein PVJ49_13605 [Acidobacteriota bacterium]|jgi:hypothetical protein
MGVTLMLTGTGHLGGPLLQRLAALPRVDRIVAVGRDARRGAARVNLARLTAMAAGYTVAIEHRVVDVARPDRVAEALVEVSPDLLVHTASLQTWWLPDLFPPSARRTLRATGYGVWLPLHLALALSLMRGVQQAGYDGPVLNAAYPDVVNVVLGRVGQAPLAGLGNVDELVAKVRLGVADELGVPAAELDVLLVAHHALQRFAFAATATTTSDGGTGAEGPGPDSEDARPPFWLRVEHRGTDVSDAGRAREALLRPCPLPGGPSWGTFSAAAASSFIEALLASEPRNEHAAAPYGLPGGYPVRVDGGRMELRDLAGLTREEAVAINERSHRFDGIDTIRDDGTVVFTGRATAAIRDALGYDCSEMAPREAAERAEDLAACFRRYAAHYDVDLDAARR